MSASEAIEKVLQFLICPQEDFIGRLANGALPSNRLHVGAFATQRLRGTGLRGASDPYVETVRHMLDPKVSGSERVHLILDEDWHPRRCDEFAVFGEHCVKGQDGARLVGELEELRWHPRSHVLRANSLNIGASPRTAELLNELLGGTRIERVRVGVFGVWTHIKVEYSLLYLSTMPPCFTNIGVCAPLCASPNNEDHVQALKKFRSLGYQVFEKIPDYLEWLGIGSEIGLAESRAATWTGTGRRG